MKEESGREKKKKKNRRVLFGVFFFCEMRSFYTTMGALICFCWYPVGIYVVGSDDVFNHEPCMSDVEEVDSENEVVRTCVHH